MFKSSIRSVMVQFAVPILAILIPSGISLWQILKTESPKKELRYEVISVTPVGPTQARGFLDLTLLRGDKPIKEPYLATIRLVNSGIVPINESDFTTPIIIKAKTGIDSPSKSVDSPWQYKGQFFGKTTPTKFIDARIAGTIPQNIQVNLSISENEVRIAKLLLNERDEILIEILVSGGPPRLTTEARISGVKEVTSIIPSTKEFDAKKLSEKIRGTVMVIIGSILALISALIWLTRAASPFAKGVTTSVIARTGWALLIMIMTSAASVILFDTGADKLQWESSKIWIAFGLYLLMLCFASVLVIRNQKINRT